MKQIPGWDLGVLQQSPLLAPLHPLIAQLDAGCFPGLVELNALLGARAQPILTGNGKPLQFVAQASGKLPLEKQYEPRCYLEGALQMRVHDWHDLFNALVWLTFPLTKAAINLRHYRSLLKNRAPADFDKPTSQRGAVRDMNTLLDESGVIVACADAELSGLLAEFHWKELFWRRRDEVRERMGFYLFGHGLYQKALLPYAGLTGHGLQVEVKPDFFAWSPERKLAHLDGLLADYLKAPQHCRSTRELTPVPLLGVPGWSPDNTSAAYYDNTAYFRPGRLRA